MPHIFISYRKKDRELCRSMHDRLSAAGHSVWWDDQLRPGKEWAPVLEEQLRRADAVIVLWTRNATRSKWVYFEAMMAAGMHKLVMLNIGNTGIPGGQLAGQNFYPFDPTWPAESQGWKEILEKIDQAVADGRAFGEPAESFDDVTWSLIKKSRDVEDFNDYLSRYPDGPHSADARERRDRCRGDGRRRTAIWWSIGMLFYLTLLAPSVALLMDYSWQNALFWADLYFPFFAFGVLCGAMMVPIYCFTLAKALRFALQCKEHTWRARALGIAVLVAAPAVMSLLVASIEVSDGYAPWQFRQAVLETPLRQLAQPVSNLIEAVPGETDVRDDTRTLQAVFEGTRGLTLRSLWDGRNNPLGAERCIAAPANPPLSSETSYQTCLAHMNNLQRVMESVRIDHRTWSTTAYAYKYLFFFLSVLFLGSYFNILYIGERAEDLRAWIARLSPWSGQRFSQILILLTAQLFLIAFWFIARMIFQLETATLLPSSGGAQFSQSIRNSYFLFFAVYLIAVGFLLQSALRVNTFQTRISVVGAALITTSLFGSTFFATMFVQSIQNFIGVHATPASTMLMAIVMIFLLFVPFVMPNLVDRTEPDLRPTANHDDEEP